jgi:hypothetical protein
MLMIFLLRRRSVTVVESDDIALQYALPRERAHHSQGDARCDVPSTNRMLRMHSQRVRS